MAGCAPCLARGGGANSLHGSRTPTAMLQALRRPRAPRPPARSASPAPPLRKKFPKPSETLNYRSASPALPTATTAPPTPPSALPAPRASAPAPPLPASVPPAPTPTALTGECLSKCRQRTGLLGCASPRPCGCVPGGPGRRSTPALRLSTAAAPCCPRRPPTPCVPLSFPRRSARSGADIDTCVVCNDGNPPSGNPPVCAPPPPQCTVTGCSDCAANPDTCTGCNTALFFAATPLNNVTVSACALPGCACEGRPCARSGPPAQRSPRAPLPADVEPAGQPARTWRRSMARADPAAPWHAPTLPPCLRPTPTTPQLPARSAPARSTASSTAS